MIQLALALLIMLASSPTAAFLGSLAESLYAPCAPRSSITYRAARRNSQ
jgi:hypothetical protein